MTKATGDAIWSYALDQDAETWSGECASREAAIAEATSELGPAVHFYVRSGYRPSATMFVPDADDIMETAAQSAYDNVGEPTEDWPAPPKEALAELDAFLIAWAVKHLEPVSFWLLDGKPERIDPATPSDKASA